MNFFGDFSGKTSNFLGTHASIEVKNWVKIRGSGRNAIFKKRSLDRSKIKATFCNFGI